MPNTGVIKRIIGNRGFGFIEQDDGSEVFFHHSGVEGTRFDDLQEGQRVEFEPTVDRQSGRSRAVQVRLIS